MDRTSPGRRTLAWKPAACTAAANASGSWAMGGEGVVMHGDGQLGADHLHRPQSIRRTHGEHVADGQQGHIDVLVRQQSHVRHQGGVAGVVDFFAAHLKNEAAGQASRHTAAVDGLEELSRAERHGDPAAQVAHLDPYPGGAEHAVRQVHGAADCGAGALGDGHGIAGMVAVTVGHKNEVCLCLVCRHGRQAIACQEGVRQYLVDAVIQQEAGVT